MLICSLHRDTCWIQRYVVIGPQRYVSYTVTWCLMIMMLPGYRDKLVTPLHVGYRKLFGDMFSTMLHVPSKIFYQVSIKKSYYRAPMQYSKSELYCLYRIICTLNLKRAENWLILSAGRHSLINQCTEFVDQSVMRS